uniref:Elongation of very long chain fatty acids protein n=1 Tax=Angiostrongylus cantonensis TaxID=6313 RepID=A0A0K0CVW7_ANGCA
MSSHAVWLSNGQTILYAPFVYDSVGPEHLWNPDVVHGFFARHWSSSIYLALGYVLLVNALQRVMETRKPMSMRTLLFLWNATLAVFSSMGTWRFGLEVYYMLTARPVLHCRPFTDSVCFSVDPHSPASFWACLFAFSKVAELGDTLFLVLRKRPVIFLHWYHHAVVLIYCWHSGVLNFLCISSLYSNTRRHSTAVSVLVFCIMWCIESAYKNRTSLVFMDYCSVMGLLYERSSFS